VKFDRGGDAVEQAVDAGDDRPPDNGEGALSFFVQGPGGILQAGGSDRVKDFTRVRSASEKTAIFAMSALLLLRGSLAQPPGIRGNTGF